MDGRAQRAVRHGVEALLAVILLAVLVWVAHALGVLRLDLRPAAAQPARTPPAAAPAGEGPLRTSVKAVLTHAYPVTMGAWAPDGRRLAVAGRLNAAVTIWDVEGAVARQALDTRGAVAAVAWSPDGRQLATAQEHTNEGYTPASARIWNAATGTLDRELLPAGDPPRYSANAVTWRPDGRRVAVALDGRKTIEVFDPATGRPLQTIRGAGKLSSDLAWSPDGRWLAFGAWGEPGGSRRVIVMEATSGREAWASAGVEDWFLSVAFDPAGSLLVAQTNGAVHVFDAARHSRLRTLGMGDVGGKGAIRFSADGRLVAAGGGGALVWSTRAWDVVARLGVPGHRVFFVALSPSGRHLALGGEARVTVLELAR